MRNKLETEIAKFIIENVPNIDQIRMVSSGTEACMSAIRLTRGYTGREKISNLKVAIMVILIHF